MTMKSLSHPQPMPAPQELLQACAAMENAIAARVARHANLRDEEQIWVRSYNQSITSGAQALALRQRLEEEQASIQARAQASEALFREHWSEALETLDRLCVQVGAQQPALADLGAVLPPPVAAAPHSLAFGGLRLGYGNWHMTVPRLMDFPFRQALRFMVGEETSLAVVRQLLLRLLISLPPGGLRVVACDPLRLGAALSDFLPLLEHSSLFPDTRILSRAADIESALSREFERLESIIQKSLGDAYDNWADYNHCHPEAPLPYTVLIVQDAPAQLSAPSLWYLERILAEGPRCGVCLLISVREEEFKEPHRRLQQVLSCEAVPLTGATAPMGGAAHVLSRVETAEAWPEVGKLQQAIRALSERYRESGARGFADLFSTRDGWNASSENGIAVPVGWKADGQVAEFALGSANHAYHALIAGRTGSGKSNFLHVLIHSLCYRYSPDEVRLFLLDYKEGIEFSIYANPPLPHAALVATQASAEYGLSVLRHLNEEISRRSACFKALGVTDLEGYRRAIATPMPRLVMIVDEFQGLFAGDRHHLAEVEPILNRLLRQGRSFGIHLILATQTLKGIDALQKQEFVSQIVMRVCLACTEDDSRIILSSSNLAGSLLSGPPLAILNPNQGERSANCQVQVPLADPQVRREQLAGFGAQAARSGFAMSTQVFDGMQRPPLPTPRDLQVPGGEGDLELMLGEHASFEALPWRCRLDARAGANLLLAGRDDQVRAELLRAVLRSLAVNPSLDSLLYFDAADRGYDPSWFTEFPADISWRVERGDWDWKASDFFDSPVMGRRKVLLIDTLDCSRFAQDSWKSLIVDRGRLGIHLILITAQHRGMSQLTLSAFERRLGFTLSDEDATGLLSPGMGAARVQGLDAAHRALYVDLGRGERVWLRPYGPSNDASGLK